jgi:hypothetical protein
MQWQMALVNDWDHVTNELKILRVRNATKEVRIKVSVFLSFARDTELQNRPLLECLRDIDGEVSRIIFAIEAETARLGK